MLTFLAAAAALAAATTPAAPTPPTLTPPQATALRCGVAFALGARLQEQGDRRSAGWPALGARGREYFVRVTAKLIDDTGLGRDAIAALAAREIAPLQAEGALGTAIAQCLPQLDAAGL